MTLLKKDIIQLVRDKQPVTGLDSALVCAMIEQESGFNPWAVRFEQAFYARYMLHLGLESSEAFCRSCSWGLLQLMGQCAREQNYLGPLPQLCDPETGIIQGCKWFSTKLEQAGHNQREALLRWNGGGDLSYPDKVLARYQSFV